MEWRACTPPRPPNPETPKHSAPHPPPSALTRHRVVCVEQVVRQRLGQLRLAHAWQGEGGSAGRQGGRARGGRARLEEAASARSRSRTQHPPPHTHIQLPTHMHTLVYTKTQPTHPWAPGRGSWRWGRWGPSCPRGCAGSPPRQPRPAQERRVAGKGGGVGSHALHAPGAAVQWERHGGVRRSVV